VRFVVGESVSEGLARAWDAVRAVQEAPADGAVLAAGFVALLVVALPQTWPLARHAITAAHEGAHGLAALLTGRRQRGITLHRDTSGRARSHGRTRGVGLIVTTAAGYPGPALLGLGAAALLAAGHAVAVLWIGLLLLALLLVQIRNVWGIWSIVVMGGALFAVAWWGPERTQSLVAYAAAWFLLLAAPRSAWELARQHRRGARGSDADALARLTPLPAVAWVATFLASTLAALWVGGGLLLG
jgi:hypothetical protein